MKFKANKIVDAAMLADYAHKGQFRKWDKSDCPYIVHPMRVASMVCLREEIDADMICAAFLHDVLEDTSITYEDLIVRFGTEIAGLVNGLTNPSKGLDAPRAKRKEIDRFHLAAQSKKVKILKLCDRIDNLKDMGGAPEDFKKMYSEESFLLLDAIGGVDKELEEEVRRLAG